MALFTVALVVNGPGVNKRAAVDIGLLHLSRI
jgi:hypothetical protein